MTADLLSRLSAATEGSAELDREVLLACGWTYANSNDWPYWRTPAGDMAPRNVVEPRPTRSLDDIDAIIHEAGMDWDRIAAGIPDFTHSVWFKGPSGEWCIRNVRHTDTRLALCIAFLRAREAGR